MSSTDLLARRQLAGMLGVSFEGDRDIYEVCGYPKILKPVDFVALYERNDIASRIIRAFPQATWRHPPALHDGEEENTESPFCEAWYDLCEEKRIYSYLERADRLSGIGEFSVLFMGFADGLNADQPLVSNKAPLLYLAPYSQTNISIAQWDTDVKSARFGFPVMYTLQRGATVAGGAGMSASINVHHTRVLHIAEYLEDNEVLGTPRLMSVFNRFRDLEKVVGGSAEIFWLYARNIVVGKVDSDAKFTEKAKEETEAQIDELMHQLRSYVIAQGIDFKNFQGASPTPQEVVNVILDLIAGAVGIPKRILVGSERGELSSDQDENNWAERIEERRTHFAMPFILRPFIQKLIDTGNLPAPSGEWWIDWPSGVSVSEEKKADIAMKKAQAAATYANSPGSQELISPAEMRASLGYDPEEMPEYEELPDIEEAPLEEEEEEAEAEELP